VVGNLEVGFLVAVLMGGMTGEDSRDVEDDGSLFVGKRVLGGGFVGKGIEPRQWVSLAAMRMRPCLETDQVKEILMWFSSTGKRKSKSSSWP